MNNLRERNVIITKEFSPVRTIMDTTPSRLGGRAAGRNLRPLMAETGTEVEISPLTI
jgi:hypothetical protein